MAIPIESPNIWLSNKKESSVSEFHSEISKLSPAPIWQFFDKICSIPHPSKHEEELAQYIIIKSVLRLPLLGQQSGLDVRRDPTGNVFIKKPGYGMETKGSCATSSHRYGSYKERRWFMTSLKTQSNRTSTVSGLLQKAQRLAQIILRYGIMLGVLASNEIKHAPIVFQANCVDEESRRAVAWSWSGLVRSRASFLTPIQSKKAKCTEVVLAARWRNDIWTLLVLQSQQISWLVPTLKGLKGATRLWYSHRSQNANKLLARFLAGHAKELLDLRIVESKRGSLRNAILVKVSYCRCSSGKPQKLASLYNYYTELLSTELWVKWR